MSFRHRLETLLRYALLAFVLAAASFLSAMTTIRLAIRGRVVTMPNVVGKPLPEAQAELQVGGLQMRIADRMYSQQPINTVVRQRPAPGEQVKFSQTAQVVLSLGPQTVPVPAIEGRSLRGARITLLESGLELGEVSSTYLPAPNPDTVLAQDPAQGASAQSPRVDILVAAGDKPPAYVMPKLVGKRPDDAVRLLASAGVKTPKTTPVPVSQPGIAPGTIVFQTPAEGARLTPDTNVDISIAQLAPAPPTLPAPAAPPAAAPPAAAPPPAPPPPAQQ